MRVGQELEAEVQDLAASGTNVVASGVSCREQLEALLDQPVVHPVQLLA
jgi:hypothetical protein